MGKNDSLAAVAAAAAEDVAGVKIDLCVDKITEDVKASIDMDVEAIKKDAIAEERSRLAALDAIALPRCESIIAAAKESGQSAEATALEMVRHLKASKALDVTEAMRASAESVPEIEAAATPEAESKPSGEDGWAAEWRSKAALRAEFLTAEDYCAFRKAEANGRLRFHGRK